MFRVEQLVEAQEGSRKGWQDHRSAGQVWVILSLIDITGGLDMRGEGREVMREQSRLGPGERNDGSCPPAMLMKKLISG